MRLLSTPTSQPHPFLSLPRAGALAALLLASLVPIPSPALDVRPGDIVTATTRLDPASGRMDALAPINPMGLAADGDVLYVLSTGASSNGIVRKVWRYDRSTGRHSLLAATPIPNNFALGRNLVAKGAGPELFIVLGGSVSRLDGVLAIDTVTGEQREIPIAAFGSISTLDLVVTPLGSLLALHGFGGVTLLTPAGDRIESPAGSTIIGAVAITPDGRLLGMAPDGRQDDVAATQLFSIDPTPPPSPCSPPCPASVSAASATASPPPGTATSTPFPNSAIPTSFCIGSTAPPSNEPSSHSIPRSGSTPFPISMPTPSADFSSPPRTPRSSPNPTPRPLRRRSSTSTRTRARPGPSLAVARSPSGSFRLRPATGPTSTSRPATRVAATASSART
ncbi:MAG: hypothetical protein KF833_08145 [Verrucomicrobiae bacterium]|nr:hypothetical protein [Verrucomicrobiae bacterium]